MDHQRACVSSSHYKPTSDFCRIGGAWTIPGYHRLLCRLPADRENLAPQRPKLRPLLSANDRSVSDRGIHFPDLGSRALPETGFPECWRPVGVLVVLEDQSENLDHLAVAARRLEHALLQSPEGGSQFGERRAVAQGAGLALDNREMVPPVVDRCGAFPFVGAGKNAAMLADDLSLGGDDDALSTLTGRLAKDAGTLRFRSRWMRHVDETRLAYSTKPLNGRGGCIRCPASSAQTSAIAPGWEPCAVCAHSSRHRVSSQSFSAARDGKLGMGRQSR